MKRTTFLLISFTLIFFGCKNGETTKTITKKPNIIYIMADDLGYADLGIYGQSKIETPNIDALGKTGMLFTQHYSGAPVCAPARSVLLTGQHMGHTYIRGNDEWAQRGKVWNYKEVVKDANLEGQRPLPTDTYTLAKLLKESGYQTGMVGKWGLGAPLTESIPTKMGFDYFFGYNCQRQAHTYNPVHLYENDQRYYLKNDTIAPGTGLDPNADPYDPASYKDYLQKDYAPTVTFDKMMGFIEDRKKEPFFMYWASPIPHLPLQAPQYWVDYYVEKFGDEEPYAFKKGERGSYFPTRYPRATYAAMISYLDENVGKLVTYLKEEGLYDNTLIIFTSDNGPTYTGGADTEWFDSARPFSSAYGRGKGFLYEGGIRVPMIASWPEVIEPGSQSDHISAFWDVFTTMNDIVEGKEIVSDGISFLNTLKGQKNQATHEYLYWEFPEYNGQVAVRMGEWKMIWKEIKKGNREVEIYNLTDDLIESKNLVKSQPELLKKFYEIIKKEHHTPEIERFIIPALEELVANQ